MAGATMAMAAVGLHPALESSGFRSPNHPVRTGLREKYQRCHFFQSASCFRPASRRCTRLLAFASVNGDSSPSSSAPSTTKSKDAPAAAEVDQSVRQKVLRFVEKQTGLSWLLGPLVATSAVLLPPLTLSLVELLQKNFWFGLGAVFGLDLIYILAADAFFVLTDKSGHHQSLPGGPPPWVAPWEIVGYPKGLPQLWDYTAYVGIGIAGLALFASIFLGKLGVAIAAFGPYLALIFIQAAYERLLCNDRLPTYPLVATAYTMYRFRQLARAMELLAAFSGGSLLVSSVRLLMAVWTFYLAAYLSQLPWLYCTWNSNRIT